jgi:energy-coupling factor transport system ATP-binding protein
MENKIEVKNIAFFYRSGEYVLRDVNLAFDSRSTAIIGQNGSGKTTFSKLLKGLLKPSEGNIIINGKNTREFTAAKLSRDIGMVFQNPNDQIFKSKVLDEVMFGPLNIGQSVDNARESALNALETVKLKDKIDENPYDLSLSERKLISVASILAMNTDIIIFDEPTISQDYYAKENIKQIIFNLVRNDKLVITITHDMDFVAETCRRVIILNQGRVILDGDTADVFSKEDILEKVYLESPHILQLSSKLGYKKDLLTLEEFIEYNRSLKE